MIVADTSVLVDHIRGVAAARRFLRSQEGVVVPAIAAWELWKGALTPHQEAAVRATLSDCLVEPFTAALAESAGTLHRDMDAAGLRRPAFDLLIAAHALHRDCPVASMDRDYKGIPGLRVVRPR